MNGYRIRYMLCLLCFILKYTYSQYPVVNRKHTSKNNDCETSSNTVLVEHFFNVIFTELHNTPPTCVCVKMCADQPTYCYPNGCLKEKDNKKTHIEEMRQPTPIKQEQKDGATKPLVYLLDDQIDFMTEYFERNNVADPKTVDYMRTDVSLLQNFRPDPFKDKFKLLSKYKKAPKMEFRYDLREQVKNMKSDRLKIENINFSHTKWPTHKYNRVSERVYNNERQSEKKTIDTNVTNFSMTVIPEKEFINNSPKYFKRELTNKADNDKILNIKLDNADPITESSTFSIENLINNIIDNNTTLSGTELNTNLTENVSKEYGVNQGVTVAENNKIKDPVMNNTSDNAPIILIKSTKEHKINENRKYSEKHSFRNTDKQNVINEITTELQNLNSTEARKLFDAPLTLDEGKTTAYEAVNCTTHKTISYGVKNIFGREEIHPISHITINNEVNSQNNKKSRQIIPRRLRNRKLN